MRHQLWIAAVLALLTTTLASWGQTAGESYTLRYTPKVGEVEESVFAGKLRDVKLGAAEFPDAGQSFGKLKREVTKLDPQTGAHTLRLTVSDVGGQLAGGAQPPAEPKTVELTLSARGEIVQPEEKPENEPLGDITGIAMSGLPLDRLAALAIAVAFPEQPVKVGDSWTTEGDADLPVLGTAATKTTTTLARVENGVADLQTVMSADLGAFEVENEMVGKIKIESGKLTADKIERQYNLQRSVMVLARGALRIELQADMGFGPLPVAATADFELKPVEAGAPAEAEPAPATETPAAEAAPQATLPTARLGPLSVGAGYSAGVAGVAAGVDLSRAPLLKSAGRYGALAATTRASGRLDVGVAGPAGGKLRLSGAAGLGPLTVEKSLAVDIKAALRRLKDAVRSLLRLGSGHGSNS